MKNSFKKCEIIFEKIINNKFEDIGNYELFELIFCFIEGYKIDKLFLILSSKDENIISFGLFILDEMGEHGKKYYADAKNIIDTNVLTDDVIEQYRKIFTNLDLGGAL
jgi:hypothetical protein